MATIDATSCVPLAGPQAIVEAAARLQPALAAGQWLRPSNVYRRDAVARLTLDWPSAASGRHLSEYLAASTLFHTSDSWSYLSRAFQSLLSGHPRVAIHLAYYAELRACLALLATRGIGIFNRIHAVVRPNSAVVLFRGGGTHPSAWNALKAWGTTTDAADLFGRVVRPEGYSLDKWVTSFLGSPAALQPMASELLLSWGLDLDRLSADYGARNDASYRPSMTASPSLRVPRDEAEYLRDVWYSFEPGTTTFRGLDRLLLRRVLELGFRARFSRTHKQASAKFRASVAACVGDIMPAGTTDQVQQFLLRQSDTDDPAFLSRAGDPVDMRSDKLVMGILGRAALLARLSTGAVRELLVTSGLEATDYKFWTSQVALERGVYSARGVAPAPAEDFVEVEESLADVVRAAEASLDRREFVAEASVALPVSVGLDRAWMWELAN